MPEPARFEREPLPDGLPGRLYRVARPGHSLPALRPVPAHVVQEWIGGVLDGVRRDGELVAPRPGRPSVVDYVCLLGTAADGSREIGDRYEARAPWDDDDGAAVWQEYLNVLAPAAIAFDVHHFPTTEGAALPETVARAAARRLLRLLQAGGVVLVGAATGGGRADRLLEAFRHDAGGR